MDDVVRLSSPGDIAAAVPHLCGFPPAESLVAVSLRGPRSRVGLTLRADLVPDGAVPALAAQVVRALRRDGAEAAALVVLSQAPPGPGGALPWTALVRRVTDALAPVPVREALLVRDGHWWSFSCAGACCPREGSPVPSGPAVERLAAERVARGRALLASREELVASVRSQPVLGPAVVRRLQEQAGQAGLPAEQARVRWREARRAWERRPVPPEPAEAAALVVSLLDARVRDAVVAASASAGEALLGLLLALARGAVPPHDAQVCAVLAVVALLEGDGALAGLAAERALVSDPRCTLAGLVLAALEAALPPREVRRALRCGPTSRRARRAA